MYEATRTIHLATVSLSFSLFVLRGVWMLRDSALLHHRLVRVLPHANDTIVLASGVYLSLMIRQYPLVHGWITAVVVLLLIYIGLGLVALRRGKTKLIRATAWAAAILVFIYIVTIARTKNALWFLPEQG